MRDVRAFIVGRLGEVVGVRCEGGGRGGERKVAEGGGGGGGGNAVMIIWMANLFLFRSAKWTRRHWC